MRTLSIPPPQKKIPIYLLSCISLLLLYCTVLFIIIVVVNDWINVAQQRSGPRYKVNVTNAVIVRKSWKTDTSSTMYGDA